MLVLSIETRLEFAISRDGVFGMIGQQITHYTTTKHMLHRNVNRAQGGNQMFVS